MRILGIQMLDPLSYLAPLVLSPSAALSACLLTLPRPPSTSLGQAYTSGFPTWHTAEGEGENCPCLPPHLGLLFQPRSHRGAAAQPAGVFRKARSSRSSRWPARASPPPPGPRALPRRPPPPPLPWSGLRPPPASAGQPGSRRPAPLQVHSSIYTPAA